MTDDRGIPEKGKKYKNADVKADGYHLICPYKKCGYLVAFAQFYKGNLIECPNCRKQIKMRRII